MIEVPHYNDINCGIQNLTISTEIGSNGNTQSQTLKLFQHEIIFTIEKIRDKEKEPDIDSSYENVKTSTLNIDKGIKGSIITKLFNKNVITN